jgi:hypothetical protein
MVAKVENDRSTKNEASALLSAALAQLDAIKRAQANAHSSTLDAAAGGARDAVLNIQNAMQSGNIDPSTLASLAAGLNLGMDVSALAAEGTSNVAATLASLRLGTASLESHAAMERLSVRF